MKARSTPSPRIAIVLGLLLAGSLPGVRAAPTCGPPGDPLPGSPVSEAGKSYVLLRHAAAAGERLGARQRRAVARALEASAGAGGALVCEDGVSSIRAAALDRLCAEPGRNLAPLWWDATLQVRQGIAPTATLSVQLALGEGPPRKAPALFVLGPVVLPPRPSETEVEADALSQLANSLATLPELQEWFRGLRQQPGLLRAGLLDTPAPHPLEPAAAAQDAPSAAGTPPRGAVPDAAPKPEANGPAAAEPASPKLDVTAPTGAGIAVATTPTAGSPPTPAAPAASRMIAIPPPPPSAKEQAETSFQVRQAVIGQGFGVGASGLLRISERGLSFSRPGRSEPDWTIGWRDLAYAGRDQGVWDAPYPLLLRRRDGSRRYLARIDAGGHYLSGDPILAAIAKERKAPAKEAAPAKTPEAHPNGQGGRP